MSSGPSPGGAPPGSARLRADREAWLADLSQDLRAEGLEASLTETVLAGECLAILDHGRIVAHDFVLHDVVVFTIKNGKSSVLKSSIKKKCTIGFVIYFLIF